METIPHDQHATGPTTLSLEGTPVRKWIPKPQQPFSSYYANTPTKSPSSVFFPFYFFSPYFSSSLSLSPFFPLILSFPPLPSCISSSSSFLFPHLLFFSPLLSFCLAFTTLLYYTPQGPCLLPCPLPFPPNLGAQQFQQHIGLSFTRGFRTNDFLFYPIKFSSSISNTDHIPIPIKINRQTDTLK